MAENNMIKLTGLWRKEKPDGPVYYQGKLSYSTNILMFKNKYKNSEKDPDLILYIAKAEKKKPEGQQQQGASFPDDDL